jgi:Predicted membrane protein
MSEPNNNGDFLVKTPDETSFYDPQDIAQNKVVSGFSYLGILFILPMIICPNSRFGRFHANQGLVLFLTDIIVGFVRFFLKFVPFGGLAANLLSLGLFIVMIMGMVNAFNGNAKELPVIGGIRILK